MSSFAKATKASTWLRLCTYGVSGSGKTYTSLRMAKGIGSKVALIDSERGRASKYADRFDFDTCVLEDKTIDGYKRVIKEAEAAKYPILIIDSLSHAWEELKDEVEKIGRAHFGGNSWAAWSRGTPKQMAFIDMITSYPGHVLTTMRSRTDWVQSVDGRGKKSYERTGTSPVQGKGIEYEFDLLMVLSTDHEAKIEKDNSGQFQDHLIDRPGEEFGRAMAAWLEDGATDPDFECKRLSQRVRNARDLAIEKGCTAEQVDSALALVKGKKPDDVKIGQLEATVEMLESLEPELAPSKAQTAAADARLADDEPAPL